MRFPQRLGTVSLQSVTHSYEFVKMLKATQIESSALLEKKNIKGLAET